MVQKGTSASGSSSDCKLFYWSWWKDLKGIFITIMPPHYILRTFLRNFSLLITKKTFLIKTYLNTPLCQPFTSLYNNLQGRYLERNFSVQMSFDQMCGRSKCPDSKRAAASKQSRSKKVFFFNFSRSKKNFRPTVKRHFVVTSQHLIPFLQHKRSNINSLDKSVLLSFRYPLEW